ncbi:hypothetical protein EDF56_106136 [Novosphingobium sp. PhB165]|uniref:hypothetical protein n=1 Tax=Novosphingobium sp. PhB165 TaxID=2485105 RepID=UPI0010525FA6|nr:hypothetical protein [Novosphingobium sp. PhB165]TCM17024.1 hypothetical protein EDF56_106136 [Novosphingobium sp. PhB165]
MVWDLRRALLRKEEFESGRLTDFEFRETVRTLKLMARAFAADEAAILEALIEHGFETALLGFPEMLGEETRDALCHRLRKEARQALIRERGDPTPYRLG